MFRLVKKAILVLMLVYATIPAQIGQRKEIRIPDIPGYKTLKCDFHMHTVFSDGDVWPDLRIQEAWSEGLDAISITDHIEYQPHKEDVSKNHNRSYEIAKPEADKAGIILIKGGEITRKMPPGHLNLLFVDDAEALVKEDWKETVVEAKKQGALLFWNHPGWVSQQPDGISRWYDEHTFLQQQNMLTGIEIVNGPDYYIEAHNWCIEKKLTLFGNSDIHSPIMFDYNLAAGEHRTMTLVFSKESTSDGVKDALLNRRTVVYFKNQLIGDESFLKPIFENSVKFNSNIIKTTGKATCYLQVKNNSDVPYSLQLKSKNDKINFPSSITLPANSTVLFPVRAVNEEVTLKDLVAAEYEVKNLIASPGKGINVSFNFNVDVAPKKK